MDRLGGREGYCELRLRETNVNTMVLAASTLLLLQLKAEKTPVLWEDFPNSTVSEGI